MSVSEVNCHWGDYEDNQCLSSYPQYKDTGMCEHHPYEIVEIRCYMRPTDSIMRVSRMRRGSNDLDVEEFRIDDRENSTWNRGFEALGILVEAMKDNQGE